MPPPPQFWGYYLPLVITFGVDVRDQTQASMLTQKRSLSYSLGLSYYFLKMSFIYVRYPQILQYRNFL